MGDHITARCGTCGHAIKVPATYAGKKARCPKCANPISIPTAADTTHEDMVSDADLPEVGREDLVNGEYLEDGSIVPLEEPAEDPRRRSAASQGRMSSANNARVSSPSNPRVGSRGTAPRYGGPGGQKPNPAVMIGIGVAVAAVVLIALAASMGGKPHAKTGTTKKEAPSVEHQKPPSTMEEDAALLARALKYADAVGSQDPNRILSYYAYLPDDQGDMLRSVNRILSSGEKYENATGKADSTTGAVVLTFGGGREKALTWKQVNGLWLIADKPSP